MSHVAAQATPLPLSYTTVQGGNTLINMIGSTITRLTSYLGPDRTPLNIHILRDIPNERHNLPNATVDHGE
jgi:hypothetical protein